MVSTELILAAEGETNVLDIPLPELVWGSIAFVVLFALLWKFAFPPMRDALQKRADTIEGDLKAAEEAKLEAERVLAEYRAQLAEARTEAGKIMEEARRQADEIKRDIQADAEEKRQEIVATGQRDVQAAVGQAQADLRRQMAELSVDLAGRILGRELDPAAQQQTVDEFIDEVTRATEGQQ